MSQIFILHGLSALLVVLGFIALLATRIYVDSETKEQTQIDVGLFGKMRTNYPALVFVFLGVILSFVTLRSSFPPGTETWIIDVILEPDPPAEVQWNRGDPVLHPDNYSWKIFSAPDGSRGVLKIEAEVEEGTTFEQAFEKIEFRHAQIVPNISIDTKDELERYREAPEDSRLIDITPTTRRYRVTEIPLF